MDAGMLVRVHLEEMRSQADAWRRGEDARPLPRPTHGGGRRRIRLAVGTRLVRAGLRMGAGPLESAHIQCRPDLG